MTWPERFWAKVDQEHPSGCWVWLAYRNQNGEGYGTFRMPGGKQYAHRVAYDLLVGPVPSGLQLDHLCRNKGCVNPAHPPACTQHPLDAERQEDPLRPWAPATRGEPVCHPAGQAQVPGVPETEARAMGPDVSRAAARGREALPREA